jgi:aminoglycoside 6'-N-acetyltransferase I
MDIVPIAREHKEELRGLELALFREYLEVSRAMKWEEISPELVDQLGASSDEAFDFYLESGMSYVAIDEGSIIGFIFAQIMHHVESIRTVAWIENMGVHSEYRRQGVAYRLMERCIEVAKEKGARAAFSTIRSDNPESIMLHKKLGFLVDNRMMALLDFESTDL